MALTKMTKRNVSAKFRRTPRNARRRSKLLLASLSLLLLTLIVSGLQLPSKVGAQGDGERGARNAGVRPKRTTARTTPSSSSPAAPKGDYKTARISDGAEAGVSAESLSPILASADFDLIGLAVTASPATQTVPKNTPTAVLIAPQVPDGTDVAQIVAGMNPLYRVRGELTGPSFSNPVMLEGPIGQPLQIPAMSQAGDHVLQNLRVVDTGTDGQPVVAAVTPDSCGIVVFERILISEVHVNELTFDEIRQAGIVLTDDSYQAFNFTLGIGTSSDAQRISIPVAFPTVGITDPRPIVGTPTITGPGVDLPTFVPIMLTEGGGTEDGGGPRKAPDFGGEPVRIPGVVVFPGRVGFLHQFFEAIVIVANGAPNGAPLVLRQLHAKAKLPDNGTPANTSDDPLRIAETQTGGRVSELDLHGLGADGKYGTPDDTDSFSPGQSGQATFLLEGMKEGLHTVNFDLSASLEGLPSGPVTVTGQVPGAVLVRDVSFAVTFTHPNIVRAGQEYDLAMTMYNSGSRNITGAFAQLPPNSVSGASFIGQDTGARQFQETIKVGESATVKWRLRAHITGAVTASYVKVGEDISAGLRLITGVGDRNVPLSPESLILPDPVKHLPPSVVEAGRELLGQAWSVANAPPGSLPRGVQAIGKQVVIDRAVEMGIAGMRVDFKEAKSVSVGTLMRDWLGELQETPDEGFADAMRNTPSGFVWYDSIGAEFYKRLTGATPASAGALHLEFAKAEMPRSQFISALVTHADGARVAGARFTDAHGAKIGFGATAAERFGDSQTGASLSLDAVNALDGVHTTSVGQMLAVSKPAAGQWTLELDGWQQGSVDISLLMPATSRTFQHLTWSGVQVAAGGKYRVNFRPLNATATPVLEELRGGTWQALGVAPQVSTLNQPSPRVVGVIQVTNEVVPGGDKYGRLIGVLFSKPMSKESSETISRYAIGGGALKGSNPAEQVGGPIRVTGAKLDYGGRFVFLGLNSTIGPYIERDLTVTGVYDERRMPISPSPATTAIEARVSPQGIPPGAYLTGRVMNADGTPVANAPVVYWFQECPNPFFLGLPPPPIPIAVRNTDAQGRYSIDYVRDGDCAPLSVTVNNPTTKSEKRLTSPVAYDGQHMIFDMVFLARGGVQGTVTVGGRPAPNTFVQIVPALDVIGTKVVQTDDTGHYAATDIPVGTVSVSAVGTGTLATSSGLAAGTIEGPNQTAIINVSLQDTQGSVSGRVVHPNGSPSVGSLVVAYERIPGFSTLRADGATAVGYAFTDRDGGFKISNLLLGNVSLEVTDYVTARFVTQSVLLSPSTPQVNGLLLTLPGSGNVTGRVTDETGAAVVGAIVSAAGRAVRTDASGIYTLRELPVGTAQVSAISPETGMVGSARAIVQIGQTTTDVNITILRPAKLQGRVLIVEEGTTTPKPLAGARVTLDGLTIADTDGQGRYTLEHVEPNVNHILRVVDVGKKLGINTPVILSPGETLTRDATFRPGRIHGRVYQPDGVTPVLAQVTIYSPTPDTTEGPDFGLLSSGDRPLTAQTAADGTYLVRGLNPGTFRVSSSNVFFPTRVSEGGVLEPSGNAECNLTLVSTLAGKIQGRIFQPDGTTPAGAGVRVSLTGGSLAEVIVRTDDTGHYEFAEVFSAGSYLLTATDPVTSYSNRLNIQVSKNKDAFFDIRLLGMGGLRVRVIDGGGNPVRSGQIRVDGTEFPFAHRFAEITPDVNGVIQFDNLTEGSYAVSASERGLGGRVEATVPVGSVVETTIQLQASGAVQGKVFMPGGAIPIGLADVQLKLGGRSVGFNVTQDDDTNRGSFSFLNVPTGDFTLDVFDNRTGRVGRSAGRVTSQNEVVTVNVELLSVGTVTGRVTANGNPVDHALVHITADGSGIRGASIYATTDPDGRYRFTGIPAGRFTVTVSDAPGGQTGAASGTISGNVEPLPDTILDIALEPSQTVTGTVYQAGSTSEVVPGARVTITVNGGRVYRTSTNVNGVYRLEFVALGQVRVRAEAPTGFDRGEAPLVAGTQQGATVTSNVTLAGTGTITGNVLNHDGTPLTIGTITFTNDEWGGTPLSIVTGVQSNGRYSIAGVPAGDFALKLAVTGRVEVGSASGVALAGQTVELPIRLEDAGRVTGIVKTDDGSAPVTGADVTLFLNRASGGSLRFYTHTDAAGVWRFDNVPLGTLSVTVTDIPTGGLARAGGALNLNGQVLDTGEVRIDATPIRVESVTPANGTTGVTNNAPEITVTFNEPANAGTVNGSVQLRAGANSISATHTLAADARSVKLKPTSRLTDGQTYSVVVTTNLQDLVGHRLASEFRSTFVTADQTAPAVASISPANAAERVAPTTDIFVNFNEPLDATQDLSSVVSLSNTSKNGLTVAGASTLAADGRSITFHPSAALEEGTRYTVAVTGQRDASGNTQTAGFTSIFSTVDQSPPVIDPLPINGQRVRSFRPVITAVYRDNLSGVKVSSVVLRLDGADVTAGATVTGTSLTYTPPAPLARGSHNVSVQAADNDGNMSAAQTATFEIDDSGAIINSFTIAGAPATDGMFVTSTLQPVIAVTYNDDTGADRSATRLLLGFNGQTPQPVAASVTGNTLSYQSPTPMQEGSYAVEAIIVNNLGTSTSTGRINFTLDVDAPQIANINPANGTQHGGTTVTITGERLLNSVPPPTGVGTGLLGDYYYNTDFTDLTFQRLAPTINFDWGSQSPDPSLRPQKHSIRWSGQMVPRYTETYTFGLYTGSAVKLTIDDQVVVDKHGEAGFIEYTGQINLVAGQRYNVRIDYYQIVPNSGIKFNWSSTSQAKEVVPASQLYPHASAPIVTFGGNVAKIISAASGTPDTVVVETPAGAPGVTDVELTTDRGRGLVSGGFNYEADARTPLMPEPDTLALWHLDETGNGAVPIVDASGILNATSATASTVQPGRFVRGRARANIASGQDIENVLALGTKSFTVETWVKTAPVERTYTLVGKDNAVAGGANYSYSDFTFQILPSGALRAIVHDVNGTQWKAELSPATLRVDDNQWHYLSMVLNRDAARLSIYVDGVERSFISTVGIQAMINTNNYPLRAGHYDTHGPANSGTSAPTDFPGTLDEIRLSSTAHSADAIRQTYLGTEGTLGLVVLKSTPYALPRGTTVQMDVSGYNLSHLTATVTDSAGTLQQTRTLYSSANRARLEIVVASNAALGNAQLVLSSSAGTVTRPLIVVELGQSVYGVEPDTRVLWHMDEQSGTRVVDSSTYSIDGTAHAQSIITNGRFGRGRQRAHVVAEQDNGLLLFGMQSFTVETWMKTRPVERTYTLVGKDNAVAGGANYSYSDFTLQITPAGGLRAIVHDVNGTQWKAQMAATDYDVDDDQWHAVAMVVNRELSRLSIYVDGVERASISTAGMQSVINTNNYPLRAGHYDTHGPSISGTSAPTEFPGTLDEVRVSSTAHTPARIRADFEGNSGLFITFAAPREIKRDKTSAQRTVTTVGVEGYDLKDVSARVERQGEVLDINVSLTESTYRHARFDLAVAPTVHLGQAKLVLSKAGQPDAFADIYISEATEFVVDNDTVVLWHLNETADGNVVILDSGALSIDGRAHTGSKAATGHFLGGRTLANIVADTDFNALNFGMKSFTVETWVKTAPVERTYTLVGKDNSVAGGANYSYSDFTLQILPSGALRAIVHDINGTQWKAEMGPTTYDIDNDEWHHVAMVLSREVSRLYLYVDGVERASIPTVGMQSIINTNNYPLRAGHYDTHGPILSGTSASTSFPGILDEIRVSSTAHSAERIASDAIGYDVIRLTRIQPVSLQRGTVNVPIIITGNGLTNATLTTNRPDVGVAVVSTTATQIDALVTVPNAAALGMLTYTVTDSLNQSLTIANEIVDQKPFVNSTTDNNGTLVLWHLDEETNGAVPFAGSGDAVPTVIGGTPSSASTFGEGRFGKGRILSNIAGSSQSGTYNLGMSSFTAECWLKTGAVERTYTLVGKDNSVAGGANYSYSDFTLQITPAGGLRAIVHDINGTQWKAEMGPRIYDPATGQWLVTLDDNRWHYVAMVLDRGRARLTVYIDGVERASIPTVGMQSIINTNNYPFRAGHYDTHGSVVSGTTASTNFPGTLDEIRILLSARTAEEIRQTWTGAEATGGAAPLASAAMSAERVSQKQTEMQVTTVAPMLVGRDKGASKPQVTTVKVEGRMLDGVSARVMREGQPLDVSASVEASSERELKLNLAVAPTAPLGVAELVLSKQGMADKTVALRIVEQSEFAVEADTLALWHLDETGNGATRLADVGPHALEATPSADSQTQTGRFKAGRVRLGATANASAVAPLFGTPSFTVESWIKTAPLAQDYLLAGKRGPEGGADWSWELLATGSLRARLYDTNGNQWQVEMPREVAELTDNQWHSLALVVDREAKRLAFYVDGRERAAAALPETFGELRNLGSVLHIGHAGADAKAGAGTPEFPGVIDEVRISSTAHSAEKIANDFEGHDAPQVTSVGAPDVPKGVASIPVTLNGYGLAGTTVTTAQAGVRLAVTQSTSTQLNLLVSIPQTATAGALRLDVSDVFKRTTAVELNVVERTAWERARGVRPASASRRGEPESQTPKPAPPRTDSRTTSSIVAESGAGGDRR